MTRVAVLGAGAGGAAATVQLLQEGHDVSLWSRSEGTIGPFRAAGVGYEGALGKGKAAPARLTTSLEVALETSQVAVVCLPATAHPDLARTLARLGCDVPIVLDPGGTGGALLFREAFRVAGTALPPLAELSTLTYIARKTEPATVSIFAVARQVHGACLPGGEPAVDAAQTLFGRVQRDPNVLSTSLRNVNLVLHPPVALLSVAWVEATKGDFLIYSEAVTPGVYRLMEALDRERRALGDRLGLKLPHLVEEMLEIGSADEASFERAHYRDAIVRGGANRSIAAPASLEHRYYQEDLAYALLPFTEMARIFGVAAPVAEGLLILGSAVLGSDIRSRGLNAGLLGIEGLDAAGLLAIVSGDTS